MTTDPGRLKTPFFISPEPAEAPGLRLLLLSYHFVPGRAVGALRWQKMARFAHQRGWRLDVVTLDPSSLSSIDEIALQELSPGVRLFGVREPVLRRERLERVVWRQYDRLRRVLAPRQTRTTALAPSVHTVPGAPSAQPKRDWKNADGWKCAFYAWLANAHDHRWASEAAALARGLTAQYKYDLMVTCGPPHTVHWSGQLVAAEVGIPLVMDLRDPWSLVERLPGDIASPVWYWTARRLERQAVAGASLIVMNSQRATDAMRSAYQDHAARIMTVMNGYDEDGPTSGPPRSAQFLMVFAGSIYLDRNPRLLLRAAAKVIERLQLGREDFRIEFVGDLGSMDPDDPDSVAGLARSAGVAEHVGIAGLRPQNELTDLLSRATVLVSLYQDSQMAIPSKLFVYMQYDAWILAFAEHGSATELLLRGSDADVVDPHDLDGLVEVLARRYHQFAAGRPPVRLARDPRFSRREQAARLFERVEELIVPLPKQSPPNLVQPAP